MLVQARGTDDLGVMGFGGTCPNACQFTVKLHVGFCTQIREKETSSNRNRLILGQYSYAGIIIVARIPRRSLKGIMRHLYFWWRNAESSGGRLTIMTM